MNVIKLDQMSNFHWAIEENGAISQSRFESKEAAHIAYRNYLLGRAS